MGGAAGNEALSAGVRYLTCQGMGRRNRIGKHAEADYGVWAGLLGGVAISVFSKPLALIIGLLVFGLQVRVLQTPFFDLIAC